MNRPNSIEIENNDYYNAFDLRLYDPKYFYGCARTVRRLIERKNIEKKYYAYGNYNKRYGWRFSDNQEKPPPKAQLLLLSEWVLDNVPNMMTKNKRSGKTVLYEYPEAPDILDLEENEKFRNDKGKVFNIETRGERTPTGVYFLISDVSKSFGIKKLHNTMIHKDGNYRINVHYKYFILSNNFSNVSHINKKQLYVTYKGMLKILFSSRSGNAETFIDWATETLFTAQMGTKKQKEQLASNLIGISAKSLRQVLSKSSTNVPCIYRFALGTCRQLRKTMNIPKAIPNDYIVIKYGYTDNLVRRTQEHTKKYGSIEGVTLELMNYTYIDPKYLSKAETDIKDYFETNETPLQYGKCAELVLINPKHEKQITKQFKYIAKLYSGNVKDMLQQICDLKVKIKHMGETHKNELLIKDGIIECMENKLEIERLTIKLIKAQHNN